MAQRAALVLEVIDMRLLSDHFDKDMSNHQSSSHWISSLDQLAQHHHLTIRMTAGSDQQVLHFPQQQTDTNNNQSDSDWIHALFFVKSLRIEKIVPQQLSSPINLNIEVNPLVDVALINQRIFGFLSVMTLLAILVFATIKIMTARFLRELNLVNKGINNVEKGQYRTPLPDFYFTELTRVSDSYNQAVDRLEKVRLENQTLAERFLWLQEKERQFLAQELHDELGQSISAIKVMCVSMQKSGQKSISKADYQSPESGMVVRLKSITDICDHLYTVVRDLMKRLRPTILDELGLKAALEEVVSQWRQRNTELEISLSCDEGVEKCDDTININVYRIVQESLTNTVKHADAQNIDISLREYHSSSRPWAGNTYYQLDIVDDGQGFNVADKRFGFGLVGMRERVKSMGGTLEIKSTPGNGTTISIQIPVNTE